MKYQTTELLLIEIREAHEKLLAAVVAWRKAQTRENRARLDSCEAAYEDSFRALHDPERPYRDAAGRQVARCPQELLP